jgi:hypothetical protein
MDSVLTQQTPYLLRHRCLGSEAVYQVLGEVDGTVSAEVMSAPGLAPGMPVSFLASDAASMEQLDLAGQPIRASRAARRFVPNVKLYQGSFRLSHEGRSRRGTPRLLHY